MMFRTRFKKDIVCEFIPPSFLKEVPRLRSGGFRSGTVKPVKVIVLAYGMPGAPKAKETMEFWSKKGFWVFFPRYRGTWESAGEFLKQSPHLDILDVIDELPKGFTDLWSGKHYTLHDSRYTLYIFGGSFGGPSAILCSRDPRVTKAVAFAPVIDWRRERYSRAEPMEKLGTYIPQAFGNAYRFSAKNWQRLSRGGFYDPISETKTITGKKLLIFHAKDDRSCDYSSTKKFAKKTGSKLITLRTGGHFGFSKSIEPKIYKHIKRFL